MGSEREGIDGIPTGSGADGPQLAVDYRSWQCILQPTGRCARSGAGYAPARGGSRESAKHAPGGRTQRPGLYRASPREPANRICSRLQSVDRLWGSDRPVSGVLSARCFGGNLRRDAAPVWSRDRDVSFYEYSVGLVVVGPELADECVAV